MKPEKIVFNEVSKSFNNSQSWVIKKISFTIHPGETLVLLGSSGSGKTTTLKMINRLLEPDEGFISVAGDNLLTKNLITLRRSMGYVIQDLGLFPHMTVADNVTLILKLSGFSQGNCLQRAEQLLALVNLDPTEYLSRFPQELSGGQQQRVAIARALANDPAYLLMDEPFGALDAINRSLLQDILLQIKQKLGKTIVFVTHDILEALYLADRIAILQNGELVQIDTPDVIVQSPANEFVYDLFNRSLQKFSHYIIQFQDSQAS